MASKRKFKKQLNKMIYDTVEECFVVQMHEPAKVDVTNELVKELVEFRNTMREKIKSAKSSKDFKPVHAEAQDKANALVEKVNAL